MTLLQALVYFLREALTSLRRSWRSSAVAVVTMTFSLAIGAFFVMVTGNLAGHAEQWRDQLRITVYLDAEAGEADLREVAAELTASPLVETVVAIDRGEARRRFAGAFPQLAAALADDQLLGLPLSLEVKLDETLTAAQRSAWMSELAGHPRIDFVDDDRSWLQELDRWLAFARALGLTLGLGLLVAAVFIVAGVVRLTAYLYLEEIAVQRLVGATEFYVRGPFYVEGLLQGLIGGTLAVSGLWGVERLVHHRAAGSLWSTVLFGEFLSFPAQVAVVAAGAGAGLLGAILSLRRERLAPPSE